MAIERIDRLVAEEFTVRPADLKAHGHRCGAAKRIAVELACRLTGWTQRQVGAYYGGIGCAAVCMARQKIHAEAGAAAEIVQRLQRELTAEDKG